MVIIDIQQLHDETERFVREAGQEDIHVKLEGIVVAVLRRPQRPADFDGYWRQREEILGTINLSGAWDSTQAVAEDRERL